MGEIAIKDFLTLLATDFKDESAHTEGFRRVIEDEKWTTSQIKIWLDECVTQSKGSQDPYHKAFQDLVVSLGKRLGFDIEYGKFVGKQGEENYDGVWRKPTGETIILEVKSTTWPISGIDQLGRYIEERTKQEQNNDIFGMYVIGSGNIEPLIQQIRGSNYRERMRIITKDDLIKLAALRDELEPVIGAQAQDKLQKILMPLESIDLGNITNLIIEVANTRSAAAEEEVIEEGGEPEERKKDNPWIKSELNAYLKGNTPYQNLLLAALVQADQEPTTRKSVIYLMNEIGKQCNVQGIDEALTGYTIAGARAGFKMRRNPLGKEDIIESDWDSRVRDKVYKIKPAYRDLIIEWVRANNLWVIDELSQEGG